MAALEQASQSGYKQGLLGSQAEQTAVTAGEKVKAEILGEDTPPSAAVELLQGGTGGDQEAAKQQELLDLYNASPAAMQEILRPNLEAQGLLPVAGKRSSFNESNATAPPKTSTSSFSTPGSAEVLPKFVPPILKDTPEYKADKAHSDEMLARYDAEIKAEAEFQKLPEVVQKRMISYSKSDNYKNIYGEKSENRFYRNILEEVGEIGGADRVASLPSYHFQESSQQAMRLEHVDRQKKQQEERDARSEKAEQERKTALEIAESSPEMTEKRQQLKTDLAQKKGELPLKEVVLPTLTSQSQLGGTSDTGTFVPNETPKPNEELAARLSGMWEVNNPALDKMVEEGRVTKEEAANIKKSLSAGE